MSSFKSGSGTWILCLGSDGSSGLGPLGIRLVCVLCDGFEASGVAGAGSITGSANSFCCLLSSETCRSDFGLHSCHSSFSTFNSSRRLSSRSSSFSFLRSPTSSAGAAAAITRPATPSGGQDNLPRQHSLRRSASNVLSQSGTQPPRDPELCACNRTQNLREPAAVNLNAYF